MTQTILPAITPGQLTDNSGGTSGVGTIAVIGAAVSFPTAAALADTANAVATLAARLNALEAAVHGEPFYD